MKESDFQKNVIKEIKEMFPDSIIMKTDPTYKQGIPDLLILNGNRWASLEVKKSYEARKKPRPNQEEYVERMNNMSFSSFIYPENKQEVLDELQQALQPRRSSRSVRGK